MVNCDQGYIQYSVLFHQCKQIHSISTSIQIVFFFIYFHSSLQQALFPLAQKSVFTVLGGLEILTVKLKQPCLCFQHLLRPLAMSFSLKLINSHRGLQRLQFSRLRQTEQFCFTVLAAHSHPAHVSEMNLYISLKVRATGDWINEFEPPAQVSTSHVKLESLW